MLKGFALWVSADHYGERKDTFEYSSNLFIYACFYIYIYIYIYYYFSIALKSYGHFIVCYGLLLHGRASLTICVQNGGGLCCKFDANC